MPWKLLEPCTMHQQAVGRMISRLTWQDFEQLVDLILARTASTRLSTLGGQQEGVDLEAQNLAADEIAFVQVKGAATQKTLEDYMDRFQKRRDRYARMIFAVHTVHGNLTATPNLPIQVWTGARLAELVVRLGLGEWVEHKLG